MGQPQTRAMLDEQLDKARIVREDIHLPRFNRSLDSRMEVLHLICH